MADPIDLRSAVPVGGTKAPQLDPMVYCDPERYFDIAEMTTALGVTGTGRVPVRHSWVQSFAIADVVQRRTAPGGDPVMQEIHTPMSLPNGFFCSHCLTAVTPTEQTAELPAGLDVTVEPLERAGE